MKPETYEGFNPDKMTEYFMGRGWPVETIPIGQVKLAKVTKNAPLECGDGRFDQLEDRSVTSEDQLWQEGLEPKVRGVRILGGVNAIMAILTGGNEVGLQRATELLQRFNVAPGTHSADNGGCGFVDLWIQGELKSAVYPYELYEVMDRGGLKLGKRLREVMRGLGGRHYRLNGNHKEQGVRVNPFVEYTEDAYDGSRFRIDDWFMLKLGVSDSVRWFKVAETIEKLKPEAARLEIIIPF